MSNALFTIFVDSVLDTSKFDKGMEGSATKVESSMSRMASAAKQYLGAGGLLWSFNRANAQAMQFGQTMADVAAITELNVDKMAKSLLKLDHIFGKPAQTGYTLYETISSGIKGTEEDLLHFVEVAGKTAKVIRADTYTTSNALTTMMHAYGISARESTKLMDIMYTTVKEGKAHGNELARTLGLVVNNASESGIAIKDLFAAIATLSRTMTASNAMISLNQMMNSFLGPTEEARRVAREYGIEMDVSAIKSKGFAAVMKDVHDKVGGNVEAIKSLFGNIRAARGALVLTGSQFDNFISVLHEFDRTAGEAEVAFKTQTETAQASAERMRVAFNKMQITVGSDMEGLVKTFYKFGAAVMDGFGNAEGALGGFVNSVGGNFKSDSPWIQFLNSADKLTASWSRFFLYFTVGAKILSGFAKATASVEMAMKGMAQAGQINAAGAASAQGLGSAIPGAVSEKMPSPAKIQSVSVTEPVNQINLQLKELGVSFKQLASNISKINAKAMSLNTSAVDIHHYIQSVRGEFNLLLTNWKKIQKEMIVLSKKGETASVTIQGCSASVQAFLVSARKLSNLLLAISTKAEEIRLSLNSANASMTKAVGAIGRVSVGASTMSGSLSVIAKSIEQTNGHFLRAISYAGSVNMGVQALEARLLTLNKALAGKGAPALLRTSPASKAPTGKSSATTTSSSDVPMVPAVVDIGKRAISKGRNPLATSEGKEPPRLLKFRRRSPSEIVHQEMGSDSEPEAIAQIEKRTKITKQTHKALLKEEEAMKKLSIDQGRSRFAIAQGGYIANKRAPLNDWFTRRAYGVPGHPASPEMRMPPRPDNSLQLPNANRGDFAKFYRLQNGGYQGLGGSGYGSGLGIRQARVMSPDEYADRGVSRLNPNSDLLKEAEHAVKIAKAEEFLKKVDKKFSGVADHAKVMFTKAGIALSGVAKVGMGVFGAISAIQIGWSIGTQIAEKFKFSESKLYQGIADMMVGKAPGSTKKEEKETDSYNVTVMTKSAIKRIERMYDENAIDIGEYNRLIKDAADAYASSAKEGKRKLDVLSDALSDIAAQTKEETVSYSDSTKALTDAVDRATTAYNEHAKKVREQTAPGAPYTAKEQIAMGMRVREMTITPLSPEKQDWSKAGKPKSWGGYIELPGAQLPELLESIAKSTKPMSEGEIRKTLSPGGVQIVADYDISRIATAMAGREFDPAKAEAESKALAADVENSVANMLTNMVIERANQVEKKFDETLLQDKTDAINRAIAGGIDGSKIAEMKSDLLSTQARALQVIFFGIQQEIAEISKSAEFKKQSPEKQKQIMRKLNMQASTFYTRMNASMEAAAQASAKVLQGFFESLDRDVEKAMGSDLFIPSDEMLPSMHRTKVMALQGSSGKLEKKHKELIDNLDALTNTTIDEYMDQKRAALKDEMSVLRKAYSDPDATEQEKGIVQMKMRGVSASMAGLNEEDARKGMMLDKNRISEDIASVYKEWLQSLENVNSAQRDAALSGLGRLKDLGEQLGHRKDLGIINEDDYIKAITKNYEAQIAQLNKMLPLMVKGSDAYRNTILEMYELKKAIKDQKEAYGENKRALREGAFSTISDMTQGNNRNALYHAVNILGMMSGPSTLARLTAPSLDMQDPFTLGKAQKAQQSLAATMDSYLMSQKYEQANVGKTVTKIYDFISKNNAIVLR